MTWLLLAVAILLEVAATSAIKLAGQGNPVAIAGVVCGYLVSFALVAWIVQRLEVGVVYAIWSGAGTALVATLGVVLYGESMTALKLAGLALIVLGVVTLNLAGAH